MRVVEEEGMIKKGRREGERDNGKKRGRGGKGVSIPNPQTQGTDKREHSWLVSVLLPPHLPRGNESSDYRKDKRTRTKNGKKLNMEQRYRQRENGKPER